MGGTDARYGNGPRHEGVKRDDRRKCEFWGDRIEYAFSHASSSPRLTENVAAVGDILNRRDKSAWLTPTFRTAG